MNRSVGLFSAASWSLVGQIGFYGLQWFNMILLARLSGPEAVGLYTLGLALANPIMAMASLMLRMVYITDPQNRWTFDQYNRIRWIALPIGGLAVVATGVGLGYSDLAIIVILLAASWKVAEGLSEISYAVPHRAGNMKIIALSMILRAAFSSFFLGLTLSVSGRLDLALLAFTLVWWLSYFMMDALLSKSAPTATPSKSTLDLIRFATPMALSAAVIYLTFSVPRVILDQYENTETLGVFAAISHLLLVGMLAVNAIGSALTPRLAKNFAANNLAAFYKEAFAGVGVAIFVSTGFITVAYMAGDWLVTLIYGSKIAGHGELVFAIALASLPLYVGSIIGFVPPSLQAYKFHLSVNILTVLATGITAFWFIPQYGAMGAVYAIFVQGCFQLLNALIFFKKSPKSGSAEETGTTLELKAAKA